MSSYLWQVLGALGAGVRWLWARGVLRRKITYREVSEGTGWLGDRLDNAFVNGFCGLMLFGLLCYLLARL